MSQHCVVKVRFFAPPEHLRRYFTTFYLLELDVPGNRRITDFLLPEWANLRFHSGDLPDAWTNSGQKLSLSNFPATGPSTEGVRFTIGTSRMWGIGLLPLGWAKFMRVQAAELANAAVDGNSHPAFAEFRPLARAIFSGPANPEAELRRITEFFRARAMNPIADEARIIDIHEALVDPDTTTVAALVARTGASQRTIERTCRRYFGFSPKLLLRRQRFMRSLTHFMLDPSLKWIGAIDAHYHDQAQFVRDCRDFMDMTPRQYAALDKPVLSVMMRERVRFANSPVQTFDLPRGIFPSG